VNKSEGLKGPKWGSRREVSLPAFVADALRILKETAPEGCAFVIHNERSKEKPICTRTLQDGLYAMLDAIGIHEAERKSRNLVFHSLRHSFVTNGLESGLSRSAVMAMAGHKSEAMSMKYTHTAQILDFTAAKATMDAAMKAAGGEA
jgi:integrase